MRYYGNTPCSFRKVNSNVVREILTDMIVSCTYFEKLEFLTLLSHMY